METKGIEWVYEGIPCITHKLVFPKMTDGTRHMSTKEKLTYEECERYLPLRDGDVVFCPSVHDGDSFRICFIDHHGNKVKIIQLSSMDLPRRRNHLPYEQRKY